MGLDPGHKTIGIALSDIQLNIATPLLTLQRTKFHKDVKELINLIKKHEVCGLIIGLPISMNGSEGPRCQSVQQFAINLNNITDLPIAFWDERLSTAAVERMLISEADMTRKRRAQVVNQCAAAYILQGALDFLAHTK